jgi:hypothetical protein
MIRYALVCAKGHDFEAWFRNSETYDRQRKRSAVTCPSCGSAKVEKALMAPRINKARDASEPVATPGASTAVVPAAASPPQPVATVPPGSPAHFVQLVRRLRAEVEKSAEYVGPRFAEEARKMHYDEADKRGIYGEASIDDARALAEEGIEILPLPVLPDDHN